MNNSKDGYNTLKPCPFCGGKVLENRRGGTDDEIWYVHCMTCEAGGPSGMRYQDEDAPDWNTRTPPAAQTDDGSVNKAIEIAKLNLKDPISNDLPDSVLETLIKAAQRPAEAREDDGERTVEQCDTLFKMMFDAYEQENFENDHASPNRIEKSYIRSFFDFIEAHGYLDAQRPPTPDIAEKLAGALVRAERKLRAYVGVCTGDKELNNTVLPMCKEALAAYQASKGV